MENICKITEALTKYTLKHGNFYERWLKIFSNILVTGHRIPSKWKKTIGYLSIRAKGMIE